MIRVPDIAILAGGVELRAAFFADFIQAEVHEDTEDTSQCTISFVAWNQERQRVDLVDESIFDMGSELEIKLGYVDQTLTSIGKVEVVSTELELSSESHTMLTVRGWDLRHRLRRGTKTRTFTKMKDSDIAAQIARDNGLSAKVTDSKLTHDYVAQSAMSDLDFLRERAELNGYEVTVEGRALSFGPPKARAAPIPVDATTDLTELRATVKASDQVGSIEVRGWDPAAKKAIVGHSRGAARAPKTADGDAAYGKAKLVIVDRAITKQEEADKTAVAALEKLARGSMAIEGCCLGRPDLRAGVEIDLRGIGKRLSGVYRLSSVTHRFSARGGFTSAFSGRRTLA